VRTRHLLAAALAALVVCPVAAPHGGGAASGYRSTITAIRPAVDGLAVDVLDSDDRLLLRNDSGREVLILGYNGEPYLRFEAGGGVLRNANSPATYLNEERYGGVEVPASAYKDPPPDWERVSRGRSYEWHDHRIHWMSTIDPRKVRDAPDRPHHVFAWTVRGELGGEPLAIRGRLDYTPPPESRLEPLLLVPLAALALAGATLWWRRRRCPEGNRAGSRRAATR
jgi:hypothetical protein